MARTDVSPAQRIAGAFAQGQAEGRALVMPFLVCGYPDPDTFVAIARACAENGAAVLEIGIPFSDPIMDGPVIAAASNEVLARGQRVDEALALCARASEASDLPLVAMTYYNLFFRRGLPESARALAVAGACGAIVPDLSVEDSASWREACAEAGIAPVFLAAQTSTDARLAAIGEAGDGFVYAASLLGVTGVRTELNVRARELIERVRARTTLPVAVGIGVSTPSHVREAAAYADGVIVGSALVARIAAARDAAGECGSFVADLAAAAAR